MKKRVLLSVLTGIVLLSGCGSTTSSNPENLNELQTIFKKLAEQSFTVDYELSYASSSNTGTQKSYYTDYAIETDGYFGFNSVAQGEDLIFSYTRNDDGSIESKAPTVDLYSGMRYMKIEDYRPTFKNINLDALPSQKDADGYYTYEFGIDEENDETMNRIMMLTSGGGKNPTSLRFKVVGNSLISEGVGNVYGEGEDAKKDWVNASFYDIGTTEILDIKEYLDEGGTAKDFVDDRFVFFMLPYFVSTNYSIDVDLSGMPDENLPNKFYSKKYVDNAEFSYSKGQEDEGYGYIQYGGIVSSFALDEENNIIFQSPAMADTTTAMTDIWYEEIGNSFLNITPSNLNGYMTTNDEGEKEYHITDTQFISVITNLSNTGYNDTYFVDEAIITIDNFDEYAFTVELNYYNRSTKIDKGTAYLHFYDLNKTEITSVNRLMYEGDDPTTQSKDDFMKGMNLFKENNYSEHVISGDGLYINTYVYNPNYTFYYTESQGLGSGYGFIKDKDGSIKKGTITSDDEVKLETATYSYKIPGVAKTYGTEDDMAYVSSPIVYNGSSVDEAKTQIVREALYNPDNYEVYQEGTLSMWQNTNADVMNWVKSYFAPIFGSTYTPYAVGFRTSLKDESEKLNIMNKVTLYISVFDQDGNTYSTSFKFFNLGGSNIDIIDEYQKA